MIVKAQSPLTDPNAMWLVYGEGKSKLAVVHKGVIPQNVRDAVTKGFGKAYFEATFSGKQPQFGAQVGEQPW